MDNLTIAIAIFDIIIAIFIVCVIIINKTFTKYSTLPKEITEQYIAPSRNYYVFTQDISDADSWGNLCGKRTDIVPDYVSNNYISLIDPKEQISTLNNIGSTNEKFIEDTYVIVPKFNTNPGVTDNECRRCYTMAPHLYEELFPGDSPGATLKELYNEENNCRKSAEISCRTSCENAGDDCLGYVMLEKRFTLPTPSNEDDPNLKDKTRGEYISFIENAQSCNSKANLLGPIHDIRCGHITKEKMKKDYKVCVSRSDKYDILDILCELNPDESCPHGYECSPRPSYTGNFDNYKTIYYTCDHGSGIGMPYVNPSSSYPVQQNTILNPTQTNMNLKNNADIAESILKNQMYSQRGLLKNDINSGWKIPDLPIPLQDQWYTVCQASTNIGGDNINPIDIGTANYKIDASISPIHDSFITISNSPTNKFLYPQAIAQKECEDICLKQSFEIAFPGTDNNMNYECGGYTVTQLDPSTEDPIRYNCKIYDNNVEAVIPYKFSPIKESKSPAVPTPCVSPSPSPCSLIPMSDDSSIVIDACGMSNQMPVKEDDTGSFYNRHIAKLIRGGNPTDNDYYNKYIYLQFPGNNEITFKECTDKYQSTNAQTVNVCDVGVPFGKIRTSSPPPKFLPNPDLDKLLDKTNSSPTNFWFPYNNP